eukprot:6000249-Prorocentrum_lima.AAC.1
MRRVALRTSDEPLHWWHACCVHAALLRMAGPVAGGACQCTSFAGQRLGRAVAVSVVMHWPSATWSVV